MPNILSLGMFPEEHFYHFKVKLWANLFDNKSLSSKKRKTIQYRRKLFKRKFIGFLLYGINTII